MTCSAKRSPMKVNFPNCGKKRFWVILCHGRRLYDHRKFEKKLDLKKRVQPKYHQSFLTKNVPTIHINQRHLRLEKSCRFEFHHLGTSKNSVVILGRGGQRLTTLVDFKNNRLTWNSHFFHREILKCLLHSDMVDVLYLLLDHFLEKRMVAVGLLCTLQTKWQHNKLLANM